MSTTSKYSVLVNGLSRESAYKERTLVNRLNACKRYMGDIFKGVDDKLDEMSGDDRLDSKSLLKIMKYVLDYDRIGLWNPIKDGNPAKPNMEADRLLGENGTLTAEEYLKKDKEGTLNQSDYHKLSDVEKLRVNQLTDGGRCGISIHRLAQVAYGVGTIFLVQEGIATIKKDSKLHEDIKNGEYDEAFLKYAKQYHESGSSSQKRKAQKDESDSDEVPSLEAYEDGELTPSDVESDEVLETWYDQVESTGKKGAIRRELNKRERQKEES